MPDTTDPKIATKIQRAVDTLTVAVGGVINVLGSLNVEAGATVTGLAPRHPTSAGNYQLNVADGVATWAAQGLPAPPVGDGDYKLNIASGVATWVAI